MIAAGEKVSIIIPNYNGEKYLERCLESIVYQSYSNIEIIVIDDGSSDNSLEVIRKYCKKDKRVRLYESQHKGPNIARGIGITYSTGEYVMFVDSDDYIDKRAVETIVDSFKRHKDVDAVRFNYLDVRNNKVGNPILSRGAEAVIDNAEIKRLLLTTYKLNSLWSQAYKKNRVINIKAFSSSIKNGEDFLANLEIHSNTSKMLVLNAEPLYYYCENPKSTTRSVERQMIVNNIIDSINNSRIALKQAGEFGEELKKEATLAQMKMIRQSIMNLGKIKPYNKKMFMDDMNSILTVENLSFIDKDYLLTSLKIQNLKEYAKYKKVLPAIREGNLDYLWKYIKMIKRFRKLTRRS